jgi:hypothetical protein
LPAKISVKASAEMKDIIKYAEKGAATERLLVCVNINTFEIVELDLQEQITQSITNRFEATESVSESNTETSGTA